MAQTGAQKTSTTCHPRKTVRNQRRQTTVNHRTSTTTNTNHRRLTTRILTIPVSPLARTGVATGGRGSRADPKAPPWRTMWATPPPWRPPLGPRAAWTWLPAGTVGVVKTAFGHGWVISMRDAIAYAWNKVFMRWNYRAVKRCFSLSNATGVLHHIFKIKFIWLITFIR